MKMGPVRVYVTDGTDDATVAFDDPTPLAGVTYDEGTHLSRDNTGLSYDDQTKVYALKISNTPGYVLPSTGGVGPAAYYLLGSLLILIAGALLILRRRRGA